MKGSAQYSINTKVSSQFAIAGIDKRLVCKSYMIIIRMKEQATLNEKFKILNCELLLKVKQKFTTADHGQKRGFLQK